MRFEKNSKAYLYRWASSRFCAACVALLLVFSLTLTGCASDTTDSRSANLSSSHNSASTTSQTATDAAVDLDNIPDYTGTTAYVEVNNNEPEFSQEEYATACEAIQESNQGDESEVEALESYSSLDKLGRCGSTYALVGEETMPEGERGNISEIKPTGWHSSKYDYVDGGSLYNRCHLIAWMLAGENANRENLITGTRYMNTEGMLPFEDEVHDYVEETGNHVMYTVTPVFKNQELVARGVHMEAYSVEDKGRSVCFNVYCYNVQPGVNIDYATGDNWADKSIGAKALSGEDGQSSTSNSSNASGSSASSSGEGASSDSSSSSASSSDASSANASQASGDYVLNTNTKKFHRPKCAGASDISRSNRQDFSGSRKDLIDRGYRPCKRCNP